MGLNIHLYDLSHANPTPDDRFDFYRHSEDIEFYHWLSDGNAVYRLEGGEEDAHVLRARLFLPDAYDILSILTAGKVANAEAFSFLYPGKVYERPKDLAVARAWVDGIIEPYKDKPRLYDLLDLLEGDENLWLYMSL